SGDFSPIGSSPWPDDHFTDQHPAEDIVIIPDSGSYVTDYGYSGNTNDGQQNQMDYGYSENTPDWQQNQVDYGYSGNVTDWQQNPVDYSYSGNTTDWQQNPVEYGYSENTPHWQQNQVDYWQQDPENLGPEVIQILDQIPPAQ
ncbi:MAG: hypothetical protein IJ106_14620, partial [Parasporobacterium sp.]|nr:hypothetical protein [Parasporobacterium sp.]